MNKSYSWNFYYKQGDDFMHLLGLAEKEEGEGKENIPTAFRMWADSLEEAAKHARLIADACVGLQLDAFGGANTVGLQAQNEEAASILDRLVEAEVLYLEASHDEDEDEEEDEEDEDGEEEEDDRLDPTNYAFWSPLTGKPTFDYNVFVAETLDQAREVLRKWTSDEHVIVALLPTEVEAVCWQNPMSHEVIALFPMGLAKEELIDAYVAFLAQEP